MREYRETRRRYSAGYSSRKNGTRISRIRLNMEMRLFFQTHVFPTIWYRYHANCKKNENAIFNHVVCNLEWSYWLRHLWKVILPFFKTFSISRETLVNFWTSLYISLYIFLGRKKNKEGRRGKVVRQMGGCAMSHPLNFPNSVLRAFLGIDSICRIFPGATTSPQVLRAVYIIAGSDVVFRGERKDVLSRIFWRLCEWKNRSWKIPTLNYTRLTSR